MQLGRDAIADAFRSGSWKAWCDGVQIPSKMPQDFFDSIGPNSIDVTLGRSIYRLKQQKDCVDPLDEETNPWEEETTEMLDDKYVLHPSECILACTRERFDCSAPLYRDGEDGMHSFWKQDIDGRSTVGRLFLAVHMTAGFGDYGFAGAFTLEVKNLLDRPVVLHKGMRIAQVFFTQVHEPCLYYGAYSGENHYNKPVRPSLGRHRFF